MIYFFFSFFLMHLESCMVSKEYLKINETWNDTQLLS